MKLSHMRRLFTSFSKIKHCQVEYKYIKHSNFIRQYVNKCTKNKHNDKFINGPSPKPVYITIQRTAGCHTRPRSTATQCEQKNSSLDKTQTN